MGLSKKKPAQQLPAMPPDLPDPAALLADAEAKFKMVDELVVDTAEMSHFAQGARAMIDAQIKEHTGKRLEITRKIDAAKSAIMDLFRPTIDLLTLSRKGLTDKIIAFNERQEAIAREAQRKLDAAAEAEKRRLAKLAEKAEARGDADKADQFRDRASMAVAPIAQAKIAQAQGTVFVDRWDFEIKDPAQVLMLMPDEVRIGRAVRAMGLDAQALVGPGVRIFKTQSIQQRK
jgi:hypothetical protein